MSGEHPEDRGARSPSCSQDSSVTSTSVYTDAKSSSNVSPDHKQAESSVHSNQSALSESEVSSTSVSSGNAWNVTNTVEEKNPFSVMSEEDLSQIDAVLSTEEGKLILQQTGATAFKMDEMEEAPFNAMSGDLDPPMLADSSHNVEPATDADPFLNTSLFDQNSLLNVTLDTAEIPSVLLQEDELDLEASFNDHAYCLTSRKRSGYEKIEEPGTSAKGSQLEASLAEPAEKAESSPAGRGRGRGRGRGVPKPGSRRSTRIQDNEERQQAEIIRQENIRKEQEALEELHGPKGSKAPVLKSYHMRVRSPRQTEGWAALLGKRRGKKIAEKKADEDGQEAGEESQSQTDDQTEDMSDEGSMSEQKDPSQEDEGPPVIDIQFLTVSQEQTVEENIEEKDDEEEKEEDKPKGRGAGKMKGVGKTRTGVAKAAGRGRGRGRGKVLDDGTAGPGRGRGRGRGRGGKSAKGKKGKALQEEADSTELQALANKGKKKAGGKKSELLVEEGSSEESEALYETKTKATAAGKGKGSGIKGKGKKGKQGDQDLTDQPTVQGVSAVLEEESSTDDDVPLCQVSKEPNVPEEVAQAMPSELETVTKPGPSQGQAGEVSMEAESEEVKKKRIIRGGKKEHDDDEEDDDEEEDEDLTFEDDEHDADWDEEDDPDKLWCICRQPYNNRFMISCDTCEEWYHGSCVGITRAQGKAIENSNGGWTCPLCCEKKKKPKKAKGSLVKGEGSVDKPNEQPTSMEMVEIHVETADGGTEIVTALVGGSGLTMDSVEAVSEGTITEEVVSHTENIVLEETVQDQEEGMEENEEEEEEKQTPVKKDKEVEQVSPSEKARLTRHQLKDQALQEKFKRLKQHRQRKESGDSQPEPKKKKKGKALTKCLISECSKPPREGSIYCSDECIVKHAQDALKVLEKQNKKMFGDKSKPETAKGAEAFGAEEEKIVVMERVSGKILTGPNAPTATTLQSWLEKNPTFEVVTGSNPASFYGQKKDKKKQEKKGMEKEIQAIKQKWEKKEKERKRLEKEQADKERKQKIREKVKAQTGESPDKKEKEKLSDKPGQIRDSGAMSTFGRIPKKAAPAPPEKPKDSRGHRDVDHRRPDPHRQDQGHTRFSQSGPRPPPRHDPRAPGAPGPPSESAAPMGPDPVRLNVRKALKDALTMRANNADDIMLSGSEIKGVAMAIEEELHKQYGGVNPRYKNRYRSLVFNIRDHKNRGLFRKILNGTISPARAASLPPDELASRELARWREMETKHHLQLIEKTEKEAAAEGTHLIKKTHKGDLIVGDEDLSDLTQSHMPPRQPQYQPHPHPHPEPGIQAVEPHSNDTTDMHQHHLFDKNCRICTGKIPPPAMSQQLAQSPGEVKKVKFSAYMEARGKVMTEAKKEDPSASNMNAGFYRELAQGVAQPYPPAPFMRGDPRDPRMARLQGRAPAPAPPPPPPPPPPQPQAPATATTAETQLPDSMTGKRDMSKPEAITDPNMTKLMTTVVSSPDSALQSGLDKKPVYPLSSQTVVWKGSMFMADLGKFTAHAFRVSGDPENLDKDLPDTIQIMGRIVPDQIWDYLSRIRHSANRELVVIRFQPASDEMHSNYIQLFSYLSSRNRCGVAEHYGKVVKDMYIVPLAAHSRIPSALLPFEGPGLGTDRPHMLLGVLVHQGFRRLSASSVASTESEDVDITKSVSSSHRKPQPKPSSRSSRDPRRDPRLARQSATASLPVSSTSMGPVIRKIPPQPDRPNTPPLHLMPPDQPYPRDIAASAYTAHTTTPAAAGSDASSDEDDSHVNHEDVIVRQFGKSGAAIAPTPSQPSAPKPPLAISAEDGEKPYSPSMVDMDDDDNDDDEKPYEPGDDMDLDLAPSTTTKPEPVPPPVATPAVVPGLSPVQMASLLEKLQATNASKGMTAAMVATLAATATPSSLEEQRRMLLDLTQKVEEQKQILEQKKEIVKVEKVAEPAPKLGSSAMPITVPDVTATTTSSTVPVGTSTTVTTTQLGQGFQLDIKKDLGAKPTVDKIEVSEAMESTLSSTQLPVTTSGAVSIALPPSSSESLPNVARSRLAKKMGIPLPVSEATTKSEGKAVKPSSIDMFESDPKPLLSMEPKIIPMEMMREEKDVEQQGKRTEKAAVEGKELTEGSLPVLPEAISQLFSEHTLQDLVGLVKQSSGPPASGDVTADQKPQTSSVAESADKKGDAILDKALDNAGGMFEIMRRNTEALFGTRSKVDVDKNPAKPNVVTNENRPHPLPDVSVPKTTLAGTLPGNIAAASVPQLTSTASNVFGLDDSFFSAISQDVDMRKPPSAVHAAVTIPSGSVLPTSVMGKPTVAEIVASSAAPTIDTTSKTTAADAGKPLTGIRFSLPSTLTKKIPTPTVKKGSTSDAFELPSTELIKKVEVKPSITIDIGKIQKIPVAAPKEEPKIVLKELEKGKEMKIVPPVKDMPPIKVDLTHIPLPDLSKDSDKKLKKEVKDSPRRSHSTEKSRGKRSWSRERTRKRSRSRSRDRSRKDKKSRSRSRDRRSRSKSKERRSKSRSRERSHRRSRSRSRERGRRDRTRKSPQRRRSPFRGRDRRRSPDRGRRGRSPDRRDKHRSRSSSRDRKNRERDERKDRKKIEDGNKKGAPSASVGKEPGQEKKDEIRVVTITEDKDLRLLPPGGPKPGHAIPFSESPRKPLEMTANLVASQLHTSGTFGTGIPTSQDDKRDPRALQQPVQKSLPGADLILSGVSSRLSDKGGIPGLAGGVWSKTSSPSGSASTRPETASLSGDLRRPHSKDDLGDLSKDVDLRGPPPPKRLREMEDSKLRSPREIHSSNATFPGTGMGASSGRRPLHDRDQSLRSHPSISGRDWDQRDRPSRHSRDQDERVRGRLSSPASMSPRVINQSPDISSTGDRDLRLLADPSTLQKSLSSSALNPGESDSAIIAPVLPAFLATADSTTGQAAKAGGEKDISALPVNLSEKDWEQLRKVQEQLSKVGSLGGLNLNPETFDAPLGAEERPRTVDAGRSQWSYASQPSERSLDPARRVPDVLPPRDYLHGLPLRDEHAQDVDHRFPQAPLPRSYEGGADMRPYYGEGDKWAEDRHHGGGYHGDRGPYPHPPRGGLPPHRDPREPLGRGLPPVSRESHDYRRPPLPARDQDFRDHDHRSERGRPLRPLGDRDPDRYPPHPAVARPRPDDLEARGADPFYPEGAGFDYEDYDMRGGAGGRGRGHHRGGPPQPPMPYGRGVPPPFPPRPPRARGPSSRGRGAGPPMMRGMRPRHPDPRPF